MGAIEAYRARMPYGQPKARELRRKYLARAAGKRTRLYADENDRYPHQADAREYNTDYTGAIRNKFPIINEYINAGQRYKHTKYFNPRETGGLVVGDLSAVSGRIRQLLSPGGKTIYVPGSTAARMKRIAQAQELLLALCEVTRSAPQDLEETPLVQALNQYKKIMLEAVPVGYRARVATNFRTIISKQSRRMKAKESAAKRLATNKETGEMNINEYRRLLTAMMDADGNPEQQFIYKVVRKWDAKSQSFQGVNPLHSRRYGLGGASGRAKGPRPISKDLRMLHKGREYRRQQAWQGQAAPRYFRDGEYILPSEGMYPSEVLRPKIIEVPMSAMQAADYDVDLSDLLEGTRDTTLGSTLVVNAPSGSRPQAPRKGGRILRADSVDYDVATRKIDGGQAGYVTDVKPTKRMETPY